MSQSLSASCGRPLPIIALLLISLTVVAVSCGRKRPSQPGQITTQKLPQAKEPAGPSPSVIFANRRQHNPPPLKGAGDEARRAVAAFINWAGTSLRDELDDARRELGSARENPDIVKAFTEEITKAQRLDHSRTLLVLALLGEMRSPLAEAFLRQFVNQPFPDRGTRTTEGEIVEQTALATMQAKAIDGLAYLHTAGGDEEVLRQIKGHPSIIVRSEAISAYLWNQQDKELARRRLLGYVRKGDERHIEQLTREQGERAESFNRKLADYLKAHPELIPPPPQHGKGQSEYQPKPGPSIKSVPPPKY
jgi:hypothetical protein